MIEEQTKDLPILEFKIDGIVIAKYQDFNDILFLKVTSKDYLEEDVIELINKKNGRKFKSVAYLNV